MATAFATVVKLISINNQWACSTRYKYEVTRTTILLSEMRFQRNRRTSSLGVSSEPLPESSGLFFLLSKGMNFALSILVCSLVGRFWDGLAVNGNYEYKVKSVEKGLDLIRKSHRTNEYLCDIDSSRIVPRSELLGIEDSSLLSLPWALNRMCAFFFITPILTLRISCL
jgi:hypothetical protein